jgi:hypothetical protein
MQDTVSYRGRTYALEATGESAIYAPRFHLVGPRARYTLFRRALGDSFFILNSRTGRVMPGGYRMRDGQLVEQRRVTW